MRVSKIGWSKACEGGGTQSIELDGQSIVVKEVWWLKNRRWL